MAGLKLKCIASWMIIALSSLLLERGFAFPAEGIFNGDTEFSEYPVSDGFTFDEGPPSIMSAENPKSCFHFHMSRNMSSLLSQATKMLQDVRDMKEREWLLTFIYRIKSLAEHLRTHPESRNYRCLPADSLKAPQELYFEDESLHVPYMKKEDYNQNQKDSNQLPKDANQKSQESNALYQNEKSAPRSWNQEVSLGSVQGEHSEQTPQKIKKNHEHPDSAEQVHEHQLESDSHINPQSNLVNTGTSRDSIVDEIHQVNTFKSSPQDQEPTKLQPKSSPSDNVIIVSEPPDCDTACDFQTVAEGQGDDVLIQQLHSGMASEQSMEEHMQREIKQRIKGALLEEMAPEVKKFRLVGGSKDDLLALWDDTANENEKIPSHDDSDFDYEENGAATGDLTFSTHDPIVAPSIPDLSNTKQQSLVEKVYDDSDVLVKQLVDARFEQPDPKTKSFSGQQELYLKSSTHAPN